MATALAVGLTILGYAQVRHGLQEQAEAALASDALLVVSTIDSWHTHNLADLQLIAGLPAVGRFLVDSTAAAPADVSVARELIDSLAVKSGVPIAIINARGDVVLATDAAAANLNVAHRDYFPAAMKGTSYISNVTISLATGEPIVVHAVPVLYGRRQAIGMVVAGTSVQFVQRQVDTARDRVGAGAHGVLLGPNGLVIASSIDPGWLLRPRSRCAPRSGRRTSGRAAGATTRRQSRWGNLA